MRPTACVNRLRSGLVGILILACVQAGAEEVIVVGGEDGYRPYETLDEEGQPAGFNVDLMRAIAEETGKEVEFRLGDWPEMRRALEAGEIDALGMFVSEQRREQVDFAPAHVIAHHRIFIPSGGERFDSIEALDGHSVIVQRQALSHEYLLAAELSLDLVLVDSDTEGLALLARGDHDAALLTEHRGRYAMRNKGFDGLAISGPPVLPVEYALAVRQGNTDLLETLETGLEQVKASGEFDRLYARWLQPLEDGEPRGRLLITTLAVIAAVLTLAVGWLLYRLWLSRREMREARAELEHLRERDRLTGVLSRNGFERRIDALCQQKVAGNHSVLIFNVDRFRIYNDRLGHVGADHLLRDLATRMTSLLPEDAVIARVGADEFAILLTDTEGEDADAFGRQIARSLIDEPLLDAEHPPVTLSIGRVSFDQNEDSMARILRSADCACLVAREGGGNRLHVWQPDDEQVAEKVGELRWVPRIQSALREHRLALFWQPIVRTDGEIHHTVAVEMLVRIRPEDPQQAVIAAGQFMPAAERYFVASQVDRRVLDLTLDWMGKHPEALECLERVNINLSGRSLGDKRFLSLLEERVRENATLAPKICLEVTETALISNFDRARRVLEGIHRLGCGIALDDFGTGMSSMGYLRRLPVDYLKIDGSFVSGIEEDADAFEFVREINRLAQKMGQIPVAECVENPAIVKVLKRAGIELMQGYLFGRPAELAELDEHLRTKGRETVLEDEQ